MVRVVFLHPDLGIGGAERLVVDAAVALRSRGCSVQIWTAHYDPQHCFSETLSPDLPVVCVGDWLPTSVFGYFHALCAYLRMIYVTMYLLFFSGEEFDVVFCDQVSACIPFLRLARHRKKVLFYCHFPDQLLTQRNSALKRLYRAPIDWFEELSTGMADCILVNSQFTKGVFKQTFPKLAEIHTDILYPSLNFAAFDGEVEGLSGLVPEGRSFLFLSINRYERKKNLPLALQALAALKERLSENQWERVHLVMAGGYDERVTENVEHYEELCSLVASHGLEDHVTFLRSFSDKQKLSLLHSSICVLYTPSNEHFGIVPIEAMYSHTPVIAVNSGGPLESVAHGKTGFLCEPTPECFSEAMQEFVADPKLKQHMGQAGRERVQQRFSLQAFTEQLHNHIINLTQ
ncbi:alpha-1,3/1,6-mannosyltransferase ALG2 [Myxocyprinus asiaticus]|uniref:alpha-1,3/1,6-mannosyltransferase ALG2 n=1 Tax=Myxocyprinus asiaticus TaxID=70543 RepID=UPI0022229E46|nr:alpha-1,3/1,6-mannosyltransferase ALG2 [Myxocyprinus asiaticus]XP_051576719.1 alpha-1,3/1,6-mannosyltransferase ALG2 [Myxocyprinus asiaticus]